MIERIPGIRHLLVPALACIGMVSARDLELLEYGEMERLTSWVSDAGCEEPFDGTFVRISLPYARELPDGSFEPLFHYGFLQEEAADRSRARVFQLDGFESEVVAAPPGGDPRRSPGVSWQAASLRDHGQRWLETPWTASSHSRLDQPPQGHARTLAPASYAVMLATALMQNGEGELARALFEKAFRFQAQNPRDRDLRLFQAHLAESFSAVRFQRVVDENARPEVPRSEVLARLDELLQQFPRTSTAEKARSMREALLVTCEYRGEPFLEAEDLAELAPEARIDELIRQLETQRGGQMISKGYCDPFFDPRGAESPAAQLAAMGRAALPRLIEAMDDPRLTRSPARDGYTLRVGEVAISVIERIAMRRFSPFPETMAFDAHEAAKAEVLAWWERVKDIDLVAERTLAIRGGGREAGHHAASLYEEIGHESLPVIFEAARAATDLGLRGQLVTIAARGGLARSGDFLREEMRNGPYPASRVRAAAALERLGDGEEALDLMIVEWRKRRDAGFPNEPEERAPLGHASMFLLGHPAPEALAALTEGWSGLPLGIRSRILSNWRNEWPNTDRVGLLSLPAQNTPEDQLPGLFGSFGYPGSYRAGTLQSDGSVGLGGFIVADPTGRSLPPANREILEQALFPSLEETGRRFDDNASGGSHGRLCDQAAAILARLHPDRFTFSTDGSWRQREVDRLTMLNQWLEESGKPQRELPQIPETATETAAGALASISLEFPQDSPVGFRELLASTEEWKGAAPDLPALLDFAREAVAKLPGGWEMRFQLDGDPELFRGLHLGIEISPFDLEIHRRDVGTLEPDWIWSFFRTEAGGGIKTRSRQHRFRPKGPVVFDPGSAKLENLEAFEGALSDLEEVLTLTLRQAETHAILFEMHLRRAPGGE